jgi:dinuclear metal center YbgI/SA1388 family protein
MPKIRDICDYLDSFAPTRLAEDWDNVGLLAGDPELEANAIMSCLTITPESAAEAINRGAELIVSHHPLPFRPFKRLTTELTGSRLLWDLIRAGVAIYSPHTGFDSASEGINQSLAQRLNLVEIQPLNPIADDPDQLGSGRHGWLPRETTLAGFKEAVKANFGLPGIQVVGREEKGILVNRVHHVAVACGSGGSFMERAIALGCDTFVTGETSFHTCLEASARDVALVLLGHYASERFAVEALAARLAGEFSDVAIWASEQESDPLRWV